MSREMAQGLRARALAEEPSLTPRTQMVTHNHPWPQFQGIQQAHTPCTYRHTKKPINTNELRINNSLKREGRTFVCFELRFVLIDWVILGENVTGIEWKVEILPKERGFLLQGPGEMVFLKEDLKINKVICFHFMCVIGLSARVSVRLVSAWCPQKPEGHQIPGTGVTHGCEMPFGW